MLLNWWRISYRQVRTILRFVRTQLLMREGRWSNMLTTIFESGLGRQRGNAFTVQINMAFVSLLQRGVDAATLGLTSHFV